MWKYVARRLRLGGYFGRPGDGRARPEIPARALLWALVVGQLLREYAFHALEALVCSAVRRRLGVSRAFGDDALGYFTERLDPGPTSEALTQILRRAKRNKAFDNTAFIGLGLDGTTAGRSTRAVCALCRPWRQPGGQLPASSDPDQRGGHGAFAPL
jgi:hypothetical protein